MKKNLWKRALCILLCIVLVAEISPFGVLKDVFAAEVAYNPANVKMNLIPAVMSSNNDFMNDYVINQGSGNYSSNAKFTANSYSNIRKKTNIYKGKELTRGTLLMHKDNQHWYANYKWSLGSNYPVFKELMKDGQIKIGYRGDLTSDKHSNFYNHWKKKWDVAYAFINADGVSGTLISKKSAKKSDGSAQSTGKLTKQIKSGSNVKSFTFHANHEGCDCGSSKVANTAIWFEDTKAPYVKKAYASYDKAGTDKIEKNEGFSYTGNGKTTIYITLEFNENIRFATDSTEALKLQLSQFDTVTGQEIKENKATATLVELSGKKMIFQYNIPNDQKANYYVKGIYSTQDWIGGEFTGYLLGSEGNPYKSDKVKFKSTSKITDLAGNAINWTESKKHASFANSYYVDNVAPSLTSIEVAGSMINSESTTPKNEWGADTDRSSVFAGVGDSLQFSAYFSEALTNIPDNAYAYLNLYNKKTGEQVKVQIDKSKDRTWTKAATEVYGNDSVQHDITVIGFKSFKITEDMVPLNKNENLAAGASNYTTGTSLDGSPIRITKIEGLNDAVKDLRGTKLKDDLKTSVAISPKQQEYLDVWGAIAKTSLEEKNDGGEVYYNPIMPSDSKGYTFNVPIIIDDDTAIDGGKGNYASGTQGNDIFGQFYITMDGIGNNQYAFDVNYTGNGGKFSTGFIGSSKTKSTLFNFPQLGGTNNNTISIRLRDDVDYNYGETSLFKGTLHVITNDYAGNQKHYEFNLSHNVDLGPADLQVTANELSTEDNKDGSSRVTMKADVNIRDQFRVSEITYQWDRDAIQTYTMSAEEKASKDFTIELTGVKNTPVPIQGQSSNFTSKLTVYVKDTSGHTSEVVQSFSTTYGAPQANYNTYFYKGNYYDYYGFKEQVYGDFAVTNDAAQAVTSRSNSLEEPALYVRIETNTPSGVEANTLLFVDAMDGTYYVRLPIKDGQIHTAMEDYLGLDSVFEDYSENPLYGSSQYGVTASWYQVTGTIGTEGVFHKSTFTSAEAVEDTVVEEYLKNVYGELSLYIVSSDSFLKTPEELIADNFNFGGNIRTAVEYLPVYLAAEADVNIGAQILTNEAGEEVTFKQSEPLKTLDNINVYFTTVNPESTADGDIQYGTDVILWTRAKLYGTKKAESGAVEPDWTKLLYSWELTPSEDNAFTIPSGLVTETGCYYLDVEVRTVREAKYKREASYLYVNMEEEGVNLTGYSKTYTHEIYTDGKGEKLSYEVSKVVREGDADITELTIGLAADPEGWTSENILTFTKGVPTNTTFSNRNTAMRIWNAADPNGESVTWNNMNYGTGEVSCDYTPMLVTEFTAGDYSNSKIPLLQGLNTLVFEVKNINGVIESKRIIVNVIGSIDGFTLERTDNLDMDGFAESVTVEPLLSAITKVSMTESPVEFIEIPVDGSVEGTPVDESDLLKGFTYDQVGSYEYVLYDTNGNMTTQKYTIEEFDNVAPQIYAYNLEETNGAKNVFHVNVSVSDNQAIDLEQIQLTFDAEYSELLSGTEGEQVTTTIPIGTEEDYGWWEEYTTDHYGIFRTEIKQGLGDYDYDIEIWGALKYDESAGETVERELTFTTYDMVGRADSQTITVGATNVKPAINPPTMENNEYTIYSEGPISKVEGYGAGEVWFDEYLPGYGMGIAFEFMNTDGVYEVNFVDMFGEHYTQELIVTGFSSEYVKFMVSENDYTNENVVVSAVSLKDGVTIESITADEPGAAVSTSIDKVTQTANIVLQENAYVEVKLMDSNAAEPEIIEGIWIGNIDKTLEPVTVEYYYNGGTEPTFIGTGGAEVLGPVTAVVVSEEELEGTNGSLSYDFLEGRKKGDTYTFEYKDLAGNVGTITATLPYNVGVENLDGEYVPSETIEYSLEFLAKRNGLFAYAGNMMKSGNEDLKGADINTALQNYIAQAYAMNFVVDDVEDAKVIVKNSGSTAPASYTAESDTIDGVTVNGTMVNIAKNVKFDLYIVDSANRVSAIRGLDITSVDTTAPEIVVTYDGYTDDAGYQVARAVFNVEGSETIYPMISQVAAMAVEQPDGTITTKYYWDFYENGEYTFEYRDEYGNMGTAAIDIEGLDNLLPKIMTIVWHTNKAHQINWSLNKTQGLDKLMEKNGVQAKVINRSATLELNLNKPVNGIKAYDASKKEIDMESKGIDIEYTDKVARIIFTENTTESYRFVVSASGNGFTDEITVPAITCVDKDAPVISDDGGKLSADKKSKTYVFTSSEWAFNRSCSYDDSVAAQKNRTEHTWTAYHNGTYTFIFSDEAGNSTQVTIVVDDVEDKALTLSFSKNSDGSNAETDAKKLALQKGDTFYVMSNKDATLTWADGTPFAVNGGVWTALVLPTEAGFYTIKAVGHSTGDIVYGNVSVQLEDKIPPAITFANKTIYLKEGAGLMEMISALGSGVTVTDNLSKNVAFSYEGEPDETKAGLYTITYRATDEAGNSTKETRVLYIYSGNKLIANFNGSPIEPYGTRVTADRNIKIDVDYEGEGDLVILFKEGIKTTGQMKYNAIRVDNGQTIKVTGSGFYTVYVRTQNRTEMIFHLFVE